MRIERILTQTKRADISFHLNGKINITANVSRAIGLHAGDAINIARVENGVTEYYLYVERHADEMTGRHAGVCAITHGNGRNLRVFSTRLARYMLAVCGESQSVRLFTGAASEVPGIGLAIPIIIRRPQPVMP